MERYRGRQFARDVFRNTDAPLKRGVPVMPVTVTSMVENQVFVSSCVVAQRKLPKEIVEEHERILRGLGILGQVIGKAP